MKKLCVLMVLLTGFIVNAQKLKLISGDLSFLKGQTSVVVDFNYDHVLFYKENMNEKEYVSKRRTEIAADKGAAEADKWEKDWNHSKNNTFPEKYKASWNKNSKLKIADTARYRMVVETVWIYPGWFAGVMTQPAKVSTKIHFVESSKPKTILATIDSKDAPGNSNFVGVANNNDRIAEGYAKTAKSVAGLVNKKL